MRDPAVTQDAPTVDSAERHRAPNSERTGSRVLAPQVGCLPTGTSSEEAAMKDAPAEPTGTTTGPAELPTNPSNGRTAGVDWAKDDHVVAGGGQHRHRDRPVHGAAYRHREPVDR